MRASISAAAFLLLVGCGGRTVLDDPNDEIVLPDGGQVGEGSGSSSDDGGSSSTKDGGSSSTGKCGGMTCTSSEVCCAAQTGGTGTVSGTLSCVAKGMCMGVTATCGSMADCSGGDVCCGSLGAGGIASALGGGTPNITVACEKSCGTGGFQLCATDKECAKGVTCQSTPFGASLCGGIAGVLGGLGIDAGAGGFGGFGGH
jgi:hypothetical protein